MLADLILRSGHQKMREVSEVIIVQSVSGFFLEEDFELFAARRCQGAVVKTPCKGLEELCGIFPVFLRRKRAPRDAEVSTGKPPGPVANAIQHGTGGGAPALR